MLDGDLLIYQQGRPSSQQSSTQKLLLQLAPRLGLSSAEIERDLRLEKAEGFANSSLFKRVFELASQQAGTPAAAGDAANPPGEPENHPQADHRMVCQKGGRPLPDFVRRASRCWRIPLPAVWLGP